MNAQAIKKFLYKYPGIFTNNDNNAKNNNYCYYNVLKTNKKCRKVI